MTSHFLHSQVWLARCRRQMSAVFVLAALLSIGRSSALADSPWHGGRWRQVTTSHFRICYWHRADHEVIDRKLASVCEETYARLANYWFGVVPPLPAPCTIVLHPDERSYRDEVGDHARTTDGSTFIQSDPQSPIYQIALRGDRWDWPHSSLPHELTHVLFAQRFAGQRLPSWISEGTALMSDPKSKQAIHLRDWQRAQSRGQAMRLPSLLSLKDYPAATSWPPFYGQSLALVRVLVERRSPQDFVAFVDKSLQEGTDVALRHVYQIDSEATLEQLCDHPAKLAREQLARSGPSRTGTD